MKRQSEETEIEVVFNDNLNARNKLIHFIINKILEDYDKFEEIVNGIKDAKRGGHSGECN